MGNMKRGIGLLLLLLLLPAFAEENAVYSVTEVTDCAMKDSSYQRFYDSSTPGIVIPGLAEGFIPQGVTWLAKENAFLFAGYREDGKNSALLMVNADTGELEREVLLLNTDGSVYSGHAGGVCATETDIYVSNAGKLFRLSMETFQSLPYSSFCAFEQEIPVPVTASWCCWADNVLWVGEFQYGVEYPTDKSHRAKTADGVYSAWGCGYVTSGGIGDVPDYIVEIPDRIQGMTTLNGDVWLSQSYGRKNSSLLMRFEQVFSRAPDAAAVLEGQEIPVWYLDKNAGKSAMMAPPMTECLCTANGSVHVLFESAALKYMNPSNPSKNPMDRLMKITDGR